MPILICVMDGWVAMWLGWESDCMSFLKSFSSSLLFILLATFYTPHDWIYIYTCIYILQYIIWYTCKYITKYVVYLVHHMYHIYIYVYCMSWMYHLYHIHKKTFAALFKRSVKNLGTQLADRREPEKHRDEAWLSGVQTWVLTMNNRDLTHL